LERVQEERASEYAKISERPERGTKWDVLMITVTRWEKLQRINLEAWWKASKKEG
jgi:hypothetical protein